MEVETITRIHKYPPTQEIVQVLSRSLPMELLGQRIKVEEHGDSQIRVRM
jgi:hypothetical protein